MNKPQPSIGVEIDNEIVETMSSNEESRHYRRYITDRFEVIDIREMEEGLCALIADHEMGEKHKVFDGGELADGRIEMSEKGVIYRPPRADVAPFGLRSEAEMSPLHNHYARRDREGMNFQLRQEHQHSPMDDDDDTMIIVLSTDQMY
jgi:hypothetical protein|tara:strand:- start:3687 stop:4130 length:444 start_codon:yes stop_codon:yes gene_type:complete